MFGLAGGQIDGSDLAQDLVEVVLGILIHHDLKFVEGVFQAALLAGDAAQLIVRVGGAGIDAHGILKSLNGFGIVAALLVEEAELVL